jgi:two-component system nitrogen regulation response regulator NtrX
MERILIIDDNEEFVEDTQLGLRRHYDCAWAETGEAGLEKMSGLDPDLVLLDYDLGAGASGLDILNRLVTEWPDVPVVMVTKESGVRTVVRAMKEGAFDYVVKNTSREDFLDVIRKGMALRRVKLENVWLRRRLQESLGQMIGESEAILAVKREIREAAATDLAVLITGETGTGKTMIARMIHEASARRQQAFVEVNVSAIERELFNSEVFGHEKGSFTGAVAAKRGLTELAHRGTLFLDEIGDMDPPAQIKLLTAIESGLIRRVGAVKDIQVDFRLVAATHQDLEERIRQGRMRQDLYYRINQLRIRIPPLRERPEDLPALLRYFLHKHFPGRAGLELAPGTLEALTAQSWPGNVREFESAVQLAVVRGGGGPLRPDHFNLPGGARRTPAQEADYSPLTSQPFAQARDLLLEQLRRAYVERFVQEGVSVKEAAERIGISREVLHRWMKDLGGE